MVRVRIRVRVRVRVGLGPFAMADPNLLLSNNVMIVLFLLYESDQWFSDIIIAAAAFIHTY